MVITDLVRQIAALRGISTGDEPFDPQEWWDQHGGGSPLGYSTLLEDLGRSRSDRQSILNRCFESHVTSSNLEEPPSAAHRAIAKLVQRGTIRVIMTTNFDHLVEQALEAEGIQPTIVANADAAQGMTPLTHAKCTVIKLHGDLSNPQQLNTEMELGVYPEWLTGLLARVLDEYGLVVSGWSATWDKALAGAITGIRPRRYPMYWHDLNELTDLGQRIAAHQSAATITGQTSAQFFTKILAKQEALDDLLAPRLDRDMAVAQLKRCLPEPTKHLQLRDLLDQYLTRIREFIESRPTKLAENDAEHWEAAHREVREESDVLLHLLAQGVYLDRDRQHTDLWIWAIQQLMRVTYKRDGWAKVLQLQHYPALLALRTACMAAAAAQREDVVIQLLLRPTWRDALESRAYVPAFAALHEWLVLSPDVISLFATDPGTKLKWPTSTLLNRELRAIFVPTIVDEESYDDLFESVEYRNAVANRVIPNSSKPDRPATGMYIQAYRWDSEDRLRSQRDFVAAGFDEAWRRMVADQGGDPDALDAEIEELRVHLEGLPSL